MFILAKFATIHDTITDYNLYTKANKCTWLPDNFQDKICLNSPELSLFGEPITIFQFRCGSTIHKSVSYPDFTLGEKHFIIKGKHETSYTFF